MVVRIRFGRGPKVGKTRRKNQRVALVMAALLMPAAFTTTVLGLWRIAADLNWAGRFAIATGIFSHWHVWLGTATVLQLSARALNRYGTAVDQTAEMEKRSDILRSETHHARPPVSLG